MAVKNQVFFSPSPYSSQKEKPLRCGGRGKSEIIPQGREG